MSVAPVVFVSHAAADSERLVSRIKRFFEGSGVGDENYFISSIGNQLVWGKDDLDQIYDRLQQSRIFIEVITEIFLTRPRCLAEVGYATAIERISARARAASIDPTTIGLPESFAFLPMVVPPLTHDDVLRRLDRRQSPSLDTKSAVNAFCDQFRDALYEIGVKLEPAKFARAKKSFVRDWMKALDDWTTDTAVSRVTEAVARWSKSQRPGWFGDQGFRDVMDSGMRALPSMPSAERNFLFRGALFNDYRLREILPDRNDPAAVAEMIYWLGNTFRKPRYRAAILLQHMDPAVVDANQLRLAVEASEEDFSHDGLVESIRNQSVETFLKDPSQSSDLRAGNPDDDQNRRWLLELARDVRRAWGKPGAADSSRTALA